LYVYVYGGPEVQIVTNNYLMTVGTRAGRFQCLANHGVISAMIDGVGSTRRGLKFEGYIRGCMGTNEIEDQVLLVKYLINEGIVDPLRVAINGVSYGGYLSLMAIGQAPNVFKVAIAQSPVTRWEAYDTAYTERYMNTPQNNTEGYELSSVLSYVYNMPERDQALLIIHGLLDENVHFSNVSELLEVMTANKKNYDLILLPNERHGIRQFSNNVYVEARILTYLAQAFHNN